MIDRMSNSAKNSFVFILGREQELAYFELISVLNRYNRQKTGEDFSSNDIRISGNLVFANICGDDKEISELIDLLAGTIKIYKIINKIGTDLDKTLIDFINSKKPTTKINYGISSFNDSFDLNRIKRLGFSIKNKLKNKVSVRFVESNKEKELSSIVALKNKLIDSGIEYGLFQDSIGVLVALNNPEEWSKRDYEKPCFDKYSGMTPPKLARMMVNLAIGQIESTKYKARNSKQILNQNELNSKPSDFGFRNSDLRPLVTDPFCGSGNILLEAMLLGCDVVGSDISEKAVTDTKKNIEWLINEYKVESNKVHKLFRADTTNYDFKQLAISNVPLVIVTEPFLGEPKKFKPSFNAASGEYGKIKELYLSFLENVVKLFDCSIVNNMTIKRCSNIICLVFPLVETMEGKRFSLFRESVDEIRELGYTQIRNNFIYGRDYQVVKREIVLLKLT